MKKITFLYIIGLFFNYCTVFGQENNTDLERLIYKKREFSKEYSRNNCIQVYSGTEKEAFVYLDLFKRNYPEIPVQLFFKSPNWIVYTKSFPNKLEAEKNYWKIAKLFPHAQLL